jgi:hypothetical protein
MTHAEEKERKIRGLVLHLVFLAESWSCGQFEIVDQVANEHLLIRLQIAV